MSMLSFHATKLFTTIEGGALGVPDPALKRRIDFLKNFGIADEETVIAPGINGKMNELQAAFGLLHLDMVEEEVWKRKALAVAYRKGLAGVEGISSLSDIPGVRHNYAYFPVRVGAGFGLSRDELYTALKAFNVHTRKYFYPLVSHYPCYKSLPSADGRLLPVAERVAAEVLCLPIYGGLGVGAVERVCEIVGRLRETGRRQGNSHKIRKGGGR
jgi:dTDP-4-amino-4,6-dideoxygalactose transaminase